MKPFAVAADRLPHPPGPFSQAVYAGNIVFVAGQPGIDLNDGSLSDDFETQARQAFENLSTVLQASGSSLAHVVKTTVWLCDAQNFDTLNRLYAEYFPQNAPARSTPIVQLPRPKLQISIEAIALLGE
ncbi:MAG TPA: RidA family protein [Bacteroidota bacterium]|nr:RidA family protein [Bacteroidota bacterium]